MSEKQQEFAVQQQSQLKPISFEQGIVPKDYDDVMRLAGLMQSSGLAPKSLDTGQKIAIAMMMAMEIGIPIITGIQNIAVINGKAGLWGDIALAMVRKSGLLEIFEEWSEGKRKTPEWTFYCKIKRKGQKETLGSYSWEEATEAGLHDPKQRDGKADNFSPWRRWTNRMMQFKARNFVLRDQFGDVLKGIRLAEDLQDTINMQYDGETYSAQMNNEEIVSVNSVDINKEYEKQKGQQQAELTPGQKFLKEVKGLRSRYEKAITTNMTFIATFEPEIQAELKAKWESNSETKDKPWPITEKPDLVDPGSPGAELEDNKGPKSSIYNGRTPLEQALAGGFLGSDDFIHLANQYVDELTLQSVWKEIDTICIGGDPKKPKLESFEEIGPEHRSCIIQRLEELKNADNPKQSSEKITTTIHIADFIREIKNNILPKISEDSIRNLANSFGVDQDDANFGDIEDVLTKINGKDRPGFLNSLNQQIRISEKE